MQASRSFLVSGQAQQGLRGLPSLPTGRTPEWVEVVLTGSDILSQRSYEREGKVGGLHFRSGFFLYKMCRSSHGVLGFGWPCTAVGFRHFVENCVLFYLHPVSILISPDNRSCKEQTVVMLLM